MTRPAEHQDHSPAAGELPAGDLDAALRTLTAPGDQPRPFTALDGPGAANGVPRSAWSPSPDPARRPDSPITRLRRESELRGRIELLEHAPLFSVLHPRDLSFVAEKLHTVLFHKGEAIFREGEPAERMFVLDTGRVKLSIASPAGQELLIAILGRGSIFGELAIIDRGPRAMNARAMEDTRVLALDGDVFWTMLEHRPALARRLLELMARRLRRADQTSQDLIFFDAPTRLARRLLELAEDHAEPTGDGEAVRITVRVTQDEVAQMIGVTRASANRLIGSFAGRGWIDWNDGHPIIRNPEALVRRAR